MLTVDFSRVPTASNQRVLDIGCGSGRHTAAAAALPAAFVVGIDTSTTDLESAVERLELHQSLEAVAGGTWAFAEADALKIPFGNEVFDVVICSEVLEHIPEHQEAVSETIRVLRPGGMLVVSVPRFWPEKICWWLSPKYANTKGGHVRIYRKRELFGLLVAHGLTVSGSHYAHSLHVPFWWLKCLVGLDNQEIPPVRLYHRFLTWDMLKKPRPIRFLERLLDPLLGKSLVVYLRKNPDDKG